MNTEVSAEALKREGVKFVEVGFLDFHGDLRSRTFFVDRLDEVLAEGYGFDGYSVGYLNIEDSDLVAVPDPSSFYVYEVSGVKVAFFHCDLYKEGKPLETYPRYILRKLEEESPYEALVGPEVEFYVVDSEGRHDEGFYMASHPEDGLELLKRELLVELAKIGVKAEIMHHEVGPGQHEIILPALSPLKMADLVTFYKKFLKTFFYMRGYRVTFMPKPFEGLAGNGMHVHISLWRGGENVFYSDGELSEEARYFIGGLMKYTPKICAYTNPTVNSYKRLVPGFEAPVHLVWDWGNRSVLVRVPSYRKLSPKNARVEFRAPDSSGNIYLTFAAMIKAGLRGIKEKIDPGENFNHNAYAREYAGKLKTLPSSLIEALKLAEDLDFFPEEMARRYLRLKLKEWREYENYVRRSGLDVNTLKVTGWEVKRYFHR